MFPIKLTRKLEEAMENSFSSCLRKIGLPLAQKVSLIAQKLGNVSAGSWIFESSFVVFLAVMKLNYARLRTP